MTASKSPDRHTFQAENYTKRCEKEGKLPSSALLELFKTAQQEAAEKLSDPEWQKDNLEYDLRTTDWILVKSRASEAYAQNIYAALCNTQWQKIDVMPILKDEWWHCSWRYAGGIVADMLEKGDYIEWYCSGIMQEGCYIAGYVSEGTVTEEIQADFRRIGWQWREWPND
jgi:hypothetical protein